MYLEYFGLKEPPFSIAPNPRYLFMSHQHQEALAHLIYGLHGEGGVILLTGEVGTGKTTISRKLLEELPEHVDVAWIINPKLSVTELLATICDEFSISYEQHQTSIKAFTDLLSSYLIERHSRGRNSVLMIDEAQNLSAEVLEQLRLLTNLETSERKLLQIVLLGQPELKSMLERSDLRQLAQRVTARYHLGSLNRDECGRYISHRLSVAGSAQNMVSHHAMNLIHHHSGGIPRLINLITDRALLGAYSREQRRVSPQHVRQAAREVLGERAISEPKSLLPAFTITALLLLMAAAYFQPWQLELFQTTAKQPVQQPPVETVAAETAPQNEQQESPAIVEPAASEPAMEPEVATLFGTDPWHSVEQQQSDLLAYRTLFELWEITSESLTDPGDACALAESEGLKCLQMHTGIWMLERLNRPAVAELATADGSRGFAVIRYVDEAQAVIQIDQQQWHISRHELAERWLDKFTILWRQPPGYTDSLQPGHSGEAVRWLASQLDKIQGKMIPPRQSSSMDALLVERIKQLQQQEGLHPDGTAGAQTLIRINERIGLAGPRLKPERSD